MRVELLARDAGLDQAIHVLGAELLDGGHGREVEGDAAAHRVHVALERGAGAEGRERHAVRVAEARDLRHLLGGFREGDGVGERGGGRVLAAGVLGAHGVVEGKAVAEALLERGDDAVHGAGADGVHGVLFGRIMTRGWGWGKAVGAGRRRA